MAAQHILRTPHAHARCSLPYCTMAGLARCVAARLEAHGSHELIRVASLTARRAAGGCGGAKFLSRFMERC